MLPSQYLLTRKDVGEATGSHHLLEGGKRRNFFLAVRKVVLEVPMVFLHRGSCF